ncbi:MAG: SEL1-like repeat protein [Lentisphaeria bacterium]|nr:SEL1-like repeat protein [Lentisphaeria bacterium]
MLLPGKRKIFLALTLLFISSFAFAGWVTNLSRQLRQRNRPTPVKSRPIRPDYNPYAYKPLTHNLVKQQQQLQRQREREQREREQREREQRENFQTLYRKAEQGDSSAQYELALCFLHGTGVAKDERVAEAWLWKAAAKGNKAAVDLLKSKGWW